MPDFTRRLSRSRWMNQAVLRQAGFATALATAGALVGGLTVWGFPGAQ